MRSLLKKTKVKSNIWAYPVGNARVSHPAIFPEQLANDHIISWSNEGDIVLDPMCGSGTTCKMAFLSKRKFIGVDISEEYIENICKPRLQKSGWNSSQISISEWLDSLLEVEE